MTIMIRSMSLLMSSLERVDPGLPSSGSIDDISDCSLDTALLPPSKDLFIVNPIYPSIMPPCLNGVTEHGTGEKVDMWLSVTLTSE